MRMDKVPSCLPQTTAQERNCLDFFHNKTSKELPGVFPSAFWDHLVLQSSHANKTLLHLSIALGALHRKACGEGMAIPSQNIANKSLHFALLQYNKSVHLLQQLLSNANTRQDREICLIACVLLICFEVLRGHYGTAMVHLKNGRKVLTEYLFGLIDSHATLVLQGPARSTTEDDLTEVFARLDIQGTHFGFVSPQFKLSTSTSDMLQIPKLFTSLHEARIYIDILTNAIERFLTLEPETKAAPSSSTIERREELLHQLEQWSSAILTPEVSEHKAVEKQKVMLLRLLHRYLHLKLEICFEAVNTQLAYDSQVPIFELLLQSADACQAALPLASISLDVGIIQPLYFTAIKCRNHRLRRRALSMLWSNPHREGMWDATITALTAARIIQLEESESGTSSWIPEHARFQAVYFLPTGEGDEGGTLYCTQHKDHGTGKPGIDFPGLPEDTVVYQHDLRFDNGALIRQVLAQCD